MSFLSPNIQEIYEKKVAWISAHPCPGEIAVSTRIRLARNLRDLPFPETAPANIRSIAAEGILSALDRVLPPSRGSAEPMWHKLAMTSLTDTDRDILYENRLIPGSFRKSAPDTWAAVSQDRAFSLLINQKDHLRIQAFSPGFQLKEVWKKVNDMDNALARELDFSCHRDYGYLTSDPNEAGTGMHASVLLHLPGLVIRGKEKAALAALPEMGLGVRCFCGKPKEVAGNLFQIYNSSTLGESENEILTRLGDVVRTLIEQELDARKELLTFQQTFLYNLCGRAYGILRHAYLMSSLEALNLLSALILGIESGLLPSLDFKRILGLLVQIQPAHICAAQHIHLDAAGRAAARAMLLRRILGNSAPSPDDEISPDDAPF